MFQSKCINKMFNQVPAFTYNASLPSGPPNWGQYAPICTSGQAQSPINIVSSSATAGDTNPIFISQWYDQPSKMTFTNDGSQLVIKLLWASNLIPQLYIVNTTVSRYKLIQLQFHGANVNSTGSEHSIDNTTYDMEVQLVFSNVIYADNDAVNHPDGYVIVSKFLTGLTTGDYATSQCDTWSILLQNCVTSGSSYTTLFPWVNSLADICGNIFFSYYEYKGSFTQPGCQQAVTWFVAKTPVRIQFPMVRKFRILLNPAGATLSPNNRPQQALNGRPVILHNVAYFP